MKTVLYQLSSWIAAAVLLDVEYRKNWRFPPFEFVGTSLYATVDLIQKTYLKEG
jgi:hypothetical protein